MTSEATDEPEVSVADSGNTGSVSANELAKSDHSNPAEAIVVASKTDVGQVRSANEDTCDTFERSDGTRLLVVADGMGGHKGGATASQTAVATIASLFDAESSDDSAEMIRAAIVAANKRIFELAQNDSDLTGMGTTVVSFILDAEGQGVVAHVGDSRAYRYRQGHLEPLTVDHSVVAEMHRRGLISADEAAIHPRRNEILRSVGVVAEVDVEVAAVEVAPGDRFLLCSDGLTGVLTDDEIAAVVQAESPTRAVEQLVEMANERGAPDNVSVQILSVPTATEDTDPEATAPVELSEVGIRAIEAKRTERKRIRTATIVGIGLSVCVALYLAWRAFAPPSERPTQNNSVTPKAVPAFESSPRAGNLPTQTNDPGIEHEQSSDENAIEAALSPVQPGQPKAIEGTTNDVPEIGDQPIEDSFADDPGPPRRGIPQTRR